MILYGQRLVNALRRLCDSSSKRIWIITPFIGSWNAIEKILGRKWITNNSIDFRILTDIRNQYFINPVSFEKFKHRALVKTLPGLHAKLYLIDDSAIITSANLTGTAFSRRYEIGYLYQRIPDELQSLVEAWWETAKTVDSSWTPTKPPKGNPTEDEGKTTGLKKLWNLPTLPVKITVFRDFETRLKAHNHFKEIYCRLTPRLLQSLPIFDEIDAFYNYLFHEHPQKPTKQFLKKPYRRLTDSRREKEAKEYLTQFANWISENPDFEAYRISRMRTVQERLHLKNINSLGFQDIEKVTDSLHCMNSLQLNRKRFLNPQNNTIGVVVTEWSDLLHTSNVPIEERMEKCNENLRFFGKSAIQELISCYFPDKYPVINRNSNCGLKFFGYNVKTY